MRQLLSDSHHLDNFPVSKTGKKVATFVFWRAKKFGFLAKIFTLDGIFRLFYITTSPVDIDRYLHIFNNCYFWLKHRKCGNHEHLLVCPSFTRTGNVFFVRPKRGGAISHEPLVVETRTRNYMFLRFIQSIK